MTARRTLDVKNFENQPIGKLDSITYDGGLLTVVFLLIEGAVNPGGKFLLDLRRQGLHVPFVLYATPQSKIRRRPTWHAW